MSLKSAKWYWVCIFLEFQLSMLVKCRVRLGVNGRKLWTKRRNVKGINSNYADFLGSTGKAMRHLAILPGRRVHRGRRLAIQPLTQNINSWIYMATVLAFNKLCVHHSLPSAHDDSQNTLLAFLQTVARFVITTSRKLYSLSGRIWREP
jgi:hypothetical protein